MENNMNKMGNIQILKYYSFLEENIVVKISFLLCKMPYFETSDSPEK